MAVNYRGQLVNASFYENRYGMLFYCFYELIGVNMLTCRPEFLAVAILPSTFYL